jgi:hypothetical protein
MAPAQHSFEFVVFCCQTAWVQILALSLISCKTLGKLLNLSLPLFSFSFWRQGIAMQPGSLQTFHPPAFAS